MSRPTELHFRSPKQKTPEYYDVKVTQDGRKLTYVQADGKISDRKASFQSSLQRFPQYDQWAKKTSVFLGPGVYEDQQTYNHLNKRPCAVKYKMSQLGKESGKDCYTMIGSNMLVYEPGFEKYKDKQQLFDISKTEQNKIPLNAIFNQANISYLRANLSRGGLGAGSRLGNRHNSSNLMHNSINAQHFGKRQQSQSFYSDFQKERFFRPNTSYSGSRGVISTQSQSRNQTRNFSGFDSQQDQGNNNRHGDSIRSNTASLLYGPHGSTGQINNRSSLLKQDSTPKTKNTQSFTLSGNTNLQGFEIQNISGQRSYTPSRISHLQHMLPKDHPNFQMQSDDALTQQNEPNVLNSQNDMNAIDPNMLIYNQKHGRRPKTSFVKKPSKRHHQQNLIDLKKSVSLLQAYGEYDRFIQISKKYMRDNGIVIKKQQHKRKKKQKIDSIQENGEPSDIIDKKQRVDSESVTDENQYQEIDKLLNKKLGEGEENNGDNGSEQATIQDNK